YCTRTDECPEGNVCDFNHKRCVISCENDCECPGTNARCDLGMCQQMCIVDGECQTGELCALSIARCITAPCSMDADCYDDEECAIQMEPRVLTEPSPITTNGYLYHLFVEMDQGSVDRRVIFRAASYDGENWEMSPPAPVLESDAADDWKVGAPSVIFHSARYIMFFEIGNGAAIGRATSDDGRTWIRDAQPVVVPWGNENTVKAPSAVVHPEGDSILLYFETGNGAEIKVMESLDRVGFSFPDPDTDPAGRVSVVRPHYLDDGILWRGVSKVRSPFVTIARESDGTHTYKMLVSAYGYESAQASSFGTTDQVRANHSIGYLASKDGVTFYPYPFNPIFDRIVPNSFVNHDSEFAPAVLDLGERTVLFYGIADADGQEWSNLGWAINPPRHSFPGSF
ncbi:hypothetical protein KKF84_20100, partial [Myxococcota bacterium]|nr:hypothetical protein [Myxococcota bacterium]MBU1537628.1 hypothetical protein [Myxococcota bacterium]